MSDKLLDGGVLVLPCNIDQSIIVVNVIVSVMVFSDT
jgi:hypothetical protein